jgi:hypothetical protein
MGVGSFAGGFARGLQSGVNYGGIEDDVGAITRMRNDKDIRRIDKGARGEFEAAGSPGSFDDFYRDFIVPKKEAEYLTQGDMQSAEAWRTWADSSAARDGSKLFADGIVLAQSGDTEGALKKFIKAGNLRGYGKDLDLGNLTTNADGSLTINFDAPDGRKLAQTFTSADDVLNFGSTFFNPEAAFERWTEQNTASASTEAEIDKYRREKEIDVQLGISGPGSKRAEYYKEARNQAFEELGGDLDFADLPADKQRRLLKRRTNEILRAMTGEGGGGGGGKKARPAPTKAFNTQTGEVTDIAPAEATPAPAPGPGAKAAEPGRQYPPAGPKGDRPAARGDQLQGNAGDDRLGLGGQPTAGPTPTTAKRDLAAKRQPAANRAVTGITGQLTGGVSPASTFAEQYGTMTTPSPSAPAPVAQAAAQPAPQAAPIAAPSASKAVVRRMAAELARMKPGSPEYTQLASQIRSARQAA